MNFIGVDVKGDRLAQGGRAARELELTNTAFLRIHMQEIDEQFAENEVDEIWITFPDPRLRDRDEKRRLTFHTFLNRYKKILKPGGILHLKTDSLPFFEFSEGSLAENGWDIIVKTNDLYTSEWMGDHFGIKTRFEEMFYEKGFNINYLRATNAK
jgi:tRNA (guanine-N7-)-methyltransferase